VMYAGRIVEEADVRTLFRSPAHPYTIALLRSLPQLGKETERLFTIGGQPPDLRDLPAGCSFAPRCSKAIDVCRTEYPTQREVGDGHHVCCYVPATK
jgi:oligopeptide/dipeptide ABC transporter ATP-binding protein